MCCRPSTMNAGQNPRHVSRNSGTKFLNSGVILVPRTTINLEHVCALSASISISGIEQTQKQSVAHEEREV
ncbi:hypothetical protein JTE90_010272 [Oedothorax gibbosus]|uniref:Uncharacterized protein n=1 Tax=Oedothorax gibbosus TaxID=931172 RepID=A0AAV6TV60_9ARAC|nr:hypothetical protein JTE90_010272 [Oedothorax gibbosus]